MTLPSTFLRFSKRQLLYARPRTISPIRPFSNTSRSAYPRKDSQDKDSINNDATEYSKSGSDDKAAAQQEAAFDPKNTSPEAAKQKAGEGEGSGNPLEVSPANPEVSKPRGKTEGGAENSGKDP